LNIKSLKEVISAIAEYLFSYTKLQKKFSQIKNLGELEIFVKERSAYVTQTTLYGYLKTRMGLKYTLMFSDDIFLRSVEKSKWNIFAEAVGDLTLYALNDLYNKNKLNQISPKSFYSNILDKEKNNGMPIDIIEKAKLSFEKRVDNKDFNIEEPFYNSGIALYNWSPIADDLKILDKEIVINSIKNKWKHVIDDFIRLTKNF
tara:strand:- start:27 stop:632 length:606 start_codon:yes stop_codon:yes gene_type:complete